MKYLIKIISIIMLFVILISNINCKKDINEAPQKPRLTFPENNSFIDSIPSVLDWSCTDIDSDILTYELYLGTENPPVLIASDIEESEFSAFTIESEQTFYWKVVATDDFGNTTEGDIWSFSTGNFPPETPTNPIPENNSVGQNPTILSWDSTDPDGETLTYDIYFGTTDTPELLEQDFTENTYQLHELTGSQKYYWRIIAKDSYGNEITGPLWNFTTDFFTPELLFPEENAINAPWYPKLQWSCKNTGDLTYDVYLGTSNNPSLLVSDITGEFYHSERLVNEQTYYWKVIAKKTGGETSESPVWSFTVFGDPQFDSFTDARDGNTYQTVTIGNQIWMAENLKFNLPDSRVYDDDPLNEDIYGRLYTWEQMMNGEEESNENPSDVQGIAPEGWHIPSDSEWKELLYFLGANYDDYSYFSNVTDKLREAGVEYWGAGNTATNESGFTALPSGYFDISQNKYFENNACFNTCSKAYTNWGIYFALYPSLVQRWYDNNRYNSLRCVKD